MTRLADIKTALEQSILQSSYFDRIIARDVDRMGDNPGARPRIIEGRTPSVLCIHGFTGAPQEVFIGCDVAQELGLAAEAPLLPGHGTSSLDLAGTNFSDWLGEAKRSFDRLRKRGPVVILGLSMGSLIATELCLSAPGDVAGLILISNAFWLKSPYPSWALSVADWLSLSDFRLKKAESDLGDEEAKRDHLSYPAQPMRGGIEVLHAGTRLRERLSDIHCSTLILHGARDRVCPVENAWRAAQRLGTRDCRVTVFPHSHHILTRDGERHRVRAEIKTFVQEVIERRSSVK